MTTDPAILVTHLKADWLATADSDAGFTSTIITVANISAQSMLVKKYVNRFGDEVTMDILSFDSGLAPNSAIDFWDSSAQGARATGVRQLVLYVFNPQAGTLSRITSDIGQNASFLQVDGVIAGYDQFGLYLQLHGNFNPSVPALVSIGGMLPGSDTKVGGDTITVRPPNGAIYGPAMYDITVQQNGSAYTYPWKFVPWGKG